MKGFIEVNADLQYDPRMIAVDLIESFCNHEVVTASMSYCVKETYDEIKALIEEAQKEQTVTTSPKINMNGNTVAVELAKTVGEKNEKEYMYECDCDFCEGGAIRCALKRGGHADEWFDYTRQLTVKDGIINVALVSEDGTEENVIFEGISFCPFCGRAFQENTKENS